MNVAALGGPFDTVLDVGGNIGEFAEQAHAAWRHAIVVSFEPLPGAAKANRQRAAGRWTVFQEALAAERGERVLRWCLNQHTASSLLEHGAVRAQLFGIADSYQNVPVTTERLDHFFPRGTFGRTLLKVDVEGAELEVLEGAGELLNTIETAVVEVNTAPVFVGQPTFREIDELLTGAGLVLESQADVFRAPGGRVVQFDGVWRRV